MIKAVIFDWGDTVMEDLPSKAGPMADWDVVQETPGVRQVLESLQGKVKILLGTNAAESGERKVRQALSRVGLDVFFDAIHTAKELGVGKPDRQFFQSILNFHDLQADEALIVGDDFSNDAQGAVRAGLRSIWFRREKSDVYEHPLHDGEISRYDQWDVAYSLIQTGQIPSFVQINQLWQKYPPSHGLHRHVQLVGLTAYLLGQMLSDLDFPVSPILAQRGGLLHDLDKKVWREAGIPHGEFGAKILEQEGYSLLAEIVRRHQVFTPLNTSTAPGTLEQKLVYLADKYIEKDQFVGLGNRFDHFRNRYLDSTDLFDQVQPIAWSMETGILENLGMKQKELYSLLIRKLHRIPFN